MTPPRYSPQVTLGSILSAIATVACLLGATVAWGISYGALASGVAQNAAAIVSLALRVNETEKTNIEVGKLLAEMRTDLRYLRRYVEEVKRTKETP